MPRKGKKWIDPKKATKFRLVHRSYDDPRYGDSESSVRILAPIENPNIARKRMPDEHYEQKEKLIELVESYNQASIDAAEGNNGEAYSDDDGDDYDRRDRGADEEEEEEEEDGAGQRHRRDRGADLDDARFADADEDEEDEEDDDGDLPPLEEDERKKAPAQKSVKDVKGKGKANTTSGQAGSSKEFELGEYGFETDYDYGQHFKPMGTAGAVFMEAPTGKKGQKGQKQLAFALREDVERQKSGKIVTTEVVDFLDDDDVPEEVPEDLLAALNDPEAFESLTDDFVIAAEDLTTEGEDESQDGKGGKRKGQKVRFDDGGEEEYDGAEHEGEGYDEGEEEGDYDDGEEEEEEDEDLEALLKGLKANPEGNKRRERNEYEQVFDARFEKALAEFDDDEIGELDDESEQIKGMTTMDQLRPVLKEFISSRRRIKGIIGNDTATTKSQRNASHAGSVKGHESEGEHDGKEGQEEDDDESEDEELVLAEAEEPRDQWDCESITTTYTNTENHPTLIDDGPLRTARRPPIVLSRKTGIPLGVLPTKPAKAKQAEELDASVNRGQARPRAESKEEKRARKQQIKEARKANRERKKEMKGAFKEEELRQLSMQAKGQGQRIIRLK